MFNAPTQGPPKLQAYRFQRQTLRQLRQEIGGGAHQEEVVDVAIPPLCREAEAEDVPSLAHAPSQPAVILRHFPTISDLQG
jgi:hypothetical protein